jgi:DNA repair exonuclease SbcCD nuclease subunit
MKIIHFSDTHLGISIENTSRENDFYDNFKKVIDDIIFFRPDFVIHSGDLFHYSKPGNKALSVAIE